MNRIRTYLALSVVMIAGIACQGCNALVGPSEFTEEEIQDDLQVGPNPRILVDTFNGPIEIVTGSDGKVHYVVRKRATARSQEDADADIDNIEVEVKPV